MHLTYLLHHQIDFEKWDNVLNKCSNKLIYAESVYLNIMCGQWDAIVSNDWAFIMPIPKKKKFGFTYSPSIPFLQQLGIFSAQTITTAIFEHFVTTLQQHFKLVDYNFNYNNNPTNKTSNNFILDLNRDYQTIKSHYKKDLQKDLKTTKKVTIVKNLSTDEAINLFQQEYAIRLKNIKEENYIALQKICNYYSQLDRLLILGATNEGKTIAAAVILKDNNRLYNIASAITTEGKKNHANHFLFDYLIQTFANHPLILDFEGSDVLGIANFYKQFGTINEPYFHLAYNHLPYLIKLLKKL